MEWEEAARGTLPERTTFPWGSDKLYFNKNIETAKYKSKHQGKSMANYNSKIRERQYWTNHGHEFTANTISYWPNSIGMYNVAGNVAEMILDKGISKGGSYNSPGHYLKIASQEKYKEANPFTGFRYFIEVIELKTDVKKKEPKFHVPLLFIKDSFYSGETEVTNEMYQWFLEDLKRKDPSEYQKHKIIDSLWAKYTPYKYQQMYGWHQVFKEYPVVNISYESAVRFCLWLTEKYNKNPKSYPKNLVFRLPTQQEWELIASAGNKNSPFPLGGYQCKNSKGCYMYNYHPYDYKNFKKDTLGKVYYDSSISSSRQKDGVEFSYKVDCYFPNNFGLYNCSGNVAEMVQAKGISKGGSWNSSKEFIKIKSRESYTKANPMLGFRYVAEIKK